MAELISYIEEKRQDKDMKVFRLADLVKLYTDRLNQLARVNSKHLKDCILMHLPRMKAYKEGGNVFMACEEDVGSILGEGYQTHRDEQSVMMTHMRRQTRGSWCMSVMLLCRTSTRSLFEFVDTDVVVLVVAVVQQLAQRQQIELWIAFGMERTEYYPSS